MTQRDLWAAPEIVETSPLCHCCGAYWDCGCDPPMVALPLMHETLDAARRSMGLSVEEFQRLAGTTINLLKPRPRPQFICKGCGRDRTATHEGQIH